MYIEKRLQNGVRFIGEKLEGLRSVTIGIWVKAGSVVEKPEQNGMSHFIEHMLFKGTERRSYEDIAREMDNIGGQTNAFTSKECTCYYAKVIDERQSVATDILTDMFLHSSFQEQEIEKEKGVVLEEISMSNDSPEDVAHEKLSELYFAGHPLAQTILGPPENIRNLTRESLLAYRDTCYGADNVIVAAVGNFSESRLVAELEEQLSGIIPGGKELPKTPWQPKAGFLAVEKDIEQVHVAMGLPGYDFLDRRKYALSVVANILGGSMSSRLFQNIRERLGMAYSIYCYPAIYSSHGMLAIYAGTSPDNAQRVTQEILGEMRKMKREKITHEELENTKEQLRGHFILGQESTSSKMNSLGKNMLLGEKLLTESQILENLAQVTMEDVEECIEHTFDENLLTGVYVGVVKDQAALEACYQK